MGSAEPLTPAHAPAREPRAGAEPARALDTPGGGIRWTTLAVVALARGALAFLLALAFWAAAPVLVGMQPTTVVSGSMAPAIQPGDVVVTAAVETPAVDAVLLFDDPDHEGRLRLHRLANIADDGSLITRGDANPANDSSPVDPSAVAGVGVLRVPYVGLPVLWASEGRWGLVAAVAAGVLLLTVVAGHRAAEGGAAAEKDAAERSDAGLADQPTRRSGPWGRMTTASVVLAVVTVAAAVLLTVTVAYAAPFSAATAASSRFTAATAEPAVNLTCRSDFWAGATLSWEYTSATPESFDILIDGTVWIADVKPTARSVVLPRNSTLNFFGTSTVTVRTNLTHTWTASSASSARVYALPLTFGLPFCR